MAAVKITNADAVLDPWLQTEPDPELRRAVLERIAWIAENFDDVYALSGIPGANPLRRRLRVEGGAFIEGIVPHPNRGFHLLSISSP